MSTDDIFTAALALPESLRAKLADQLLDSLDDFPREPSRTPEEWDAVIRQRSDAIHRGEAELVDGEKVVSALDAIIKRASRKP